MLYEVITGELELKAQIVLSIRLLNHFRYSDSVTVPDLDANAIIDHGEKLGVIHRTAHPLGDVVSMSEHDA